LEPIAVLGENKFLSGDDIKVEILFPVSNMRGQASQQFESPNLSLQLLWWQRQPHPCSIGQECQAFLDIHIQELIDIWLIKEVMSFVHDDPMGQSRLSAQGRQHREQGLQILNPLLQMYARQIHDNTQIKMLESAGVWGLWRRLLRRHTGPA
jgi:hypothetical protein